MAVLRSIFILALFVFPFCALAQNNDKAEAEMARRKTALLEQIIENAKNLRLPENRATVDARIAQQIWQTDEKRARRLFQTAVNDLNAARNEVEAESGKQQNYNNLIYGQSPRQEILFSIASCDAELALDAMFKTRPPKLAQAMLDLSGDYQSQKSQFAHSEYQSEQRLIVLIAEQDPQRAVKLIRESLKKEVSYEIFNLLQAIFKKDAETANQLAEEVGQRLLDTKFDETNQNFSLFQYFLAVFGKEKTKENPSISVSDGLLRNLADKIVKFLQQSDRNLMYADDSALKTIERFFPNNVGEIRRQQAKGQNQNQNSLDKDYSKLMQPDVSADELLSQAAKFPASYRNEIYRRAAEKTAQNGNVAQAQNIITENLSEENAERYLSQFNSNLAMQAVSQGKFDEAQALLDQIPDENLRLNGLINLATAIYQKNPKENQNRAAAVLAEARSLISEVPEKITEINAIIQLANGYAQIEPAQAFSLIESLVPSLNEFSDASAVIAKYNNSANFRGGEYLLGTSNNALGFYGLMNILQILQNSDFERAVQFTNSFNRLDARIALQLQLVEFNLPFNNSNFTSFQILNRR